MPVDRDGLNPGKLPKDARVAFLTPSHQFPTGAILPLARRLAVLDWARSGNAVVVEDDYDGEFRYEGQPLESLQGLDNEGRVIYIGTFSRLSLIHIFVERLAFNHDGIAECNRSVFIRARAPDLAVGNQAVPYLAVLHQRPVIVNRDIRNPDCLRNLRLLARKWQIKYEGLCLAYTRRSCHHQAQ